MKYWLSLFILLTFLFPSGVFGACAIDGVTVVYVNGIFKSNKSDAEDDTGKLEKNFQQFSNIKDIYFLTGYNPSHLAGAADLIQSASQLLGSSISNYDLNTILLQIHPQVTTRKILFLGHSQGTFYTNEIYNYLISNGGSKESVGVYNLATPASFVSGGGAYLTSDNDKVINSVRAAAQKIGASQPLAANISIPLTQEEAANSFGGHSFSGVYLANDSVQIVSDVEKAIKKLVAVEASNAADAGCFIPPTKTLTYYIQAPFFSIADATAISLVAVNRTIAATGDMFGGFLANLGSVFKNEEDKDEGLKLASEIDLTEEASQIEELSNQIENTDAASEFDGLDQTNSANLINAADDQDEDLLEQQALQEKQPAPVPPANPALAGLPASAGGQGEKTFPVCTFETSKIPSRNNLIINEVAWMGGLASANDEWFELKNVSGADLDVSGWQILDKAEQIKITIPHGVKIAAGKFFLLERTDDNSMPGVAADQIYTGALSNADEGLRLFDGSCNLVDEVMAESEWPAGNAAERKTMERKADLSWQTSSLVSGTPRAENSSGEVAQSESAVPPPPPAPAPAPVPAPVPPPANNSTSHVVISEILFDAEGSDAGKEFIELYNPTDQTADISSWSIQHLSGSGSLTKKNFEAGDAVAPKSFFLIWLDSDSRADMVWSSGSLNNTSATVSLMNGEQEIDSVNYESSQLFGFSAGKSIERKADQNGCVSAQAGGEYLGNGCDTDNLSDWEIRSAPNPQNTGNLPESRTVAAAQNFQATYSSNNLGLNFVWDTEADLSYKLFDVTSGNPILLIATSTGSFQKGITEIGKEYKFEIMSVDREGLASDPVQGNIVVPSYLDNLVFYQDPRSASNSPQYLLDLSWNSYPFVPIGQKWHTIVFYYNQDPSVTDDLKWINFHENELYKSWGLRNVPGGFWVNYPNCVGGTTGGYALILSDDSSGCISFSVNHSGSALDWKQLEDKHLSVTAGAVNFASSSPVAGQDFVTAAFYTYVSGYEPNNYGSRLVVIDKTRHYFQNSLLVSQPPIAPQNLSAALDQNSGILTLSWDKSQDPDSLDNLITYEVSYSSTTIAASNNSIGISVDFASNYDFSVRAKDEFGNLSDAATLSYAVPDLPLPYEKLTSVNWGNLISTSTVSLKLEFSEYPFMDSNDSAAILFFVNQNPPAGYSFLDDDYRFVGKISGSNNVLNLTYYPCDFKGSWTSARTLPGLIMRNKDCPNNANGLFISELLSAKIGKQDIQFVADAAGSYQKSDYITLGFYKLGPRNPHTGAATFSNVANYNKKIYFQHQ